MSKDVHFTFDNLIKVQNDCVTIGSTLGPVLSDIFMTELKTSFLPELTHYRQFWKRYLDSTYVFYRRCIS